MKVKTGRLWLAIPDQLGVKTHAARVVFKRDPLIDAASGNSGIPGTQY